ncbi:MAG: FIST C-terminal domain-containing protein [Kiloniellales bacterium]
MAKSSAPAAKRNRAPAVAFKAAHGAGADWGTAVKACTVRLGALPPGANLGFLYATDSLAEDLSSILTFLRETTRIQDWIGSIGTGVAASGIEYHDRPAIVVMVATLPAHAFRFFEPVTGANAAGGLDRFRASHGEWLARHQPSFGIAHGDSRNPEIAQILDQVAAESSSFLIGGLTASRAEHAQIAGRVTEGGLSGAFFGPELRIASGLTQGCSPIGPVRRVTSGEGSVIMGLDDRPAVEILKEDVGELLAHDLRRIGGYIHVAFSIPGSDTGDYLVRNLTGLDMVHGSIEVGDRVETGQQVRFCRRDHDSALDDLRRMVGDVKRRAGPAPKAGVYFSCVARGQNLFGPNSEELRLIRDQLGEIPLVGFFANGEISNGRLYGYTGVLALFT